MIHPRGSSKKRTRRRSRPEACQHRSRRFRRSSPRTVFLQPVRQRQPEGVGEALLVGDESLDRRQRPGRLSTVMSRDARPRPAPRHGDDRFEDLPAPRRGEGCPCRHQPVRSSRPCGPTSPGTPRPPLDSNTRSTIDFRNPTSAPRDLDAQPEPVQKLRTKLPSSGSSSHQQERDGAGTHTLPHHNVHPDTATSRRTSTRDRPEGSPRRCTARSVRLPSTPISNFRLPPAAPPPGQAPTTRSSDAFSARSTTSTPRLVPQHLPTPHAHGTRRTTASPDQQKRHPDTTSSAEAPRERSHRVVFPVPFSPAAEPPDRRSTAFTSSPSSEALAHQRAEGKIRLISAFPDSRRRQPLLAPAGQKARTDAK